MPPPIAATSLAVLALWLGSGALAASHGAETAGPAGLAARPFARAMPSDGGGGRSLVVDMRPRESFPSALARGGVDPEDVQAAANLLADDFDTVNPHPGLTLTLAVRPTNGPATRLRLTSLELAPRDDERLGLLREADGALHLRRLQTPVFSAPSLTRGVVKGSLFLSIVEAGVAPDQAAKITRLFGRRLDLVRDVESGDRFKLVFEQHRRADGQSVDTGELLYAEVVSHSGRARLYRYRPEGATEADWVDGDTGPRPGGLLRTPVDGARLTSVFGLRMHPLLGFTRMHQGLDFGASTGTPVLAAGDGVVEEARWSGDFGRWLKIRHADGLETGYAHLSAWATGLSPGTPVRQGQIVAYVGATGLATAPHLHYQVFKGGRAIDPRTAATVVRNGHDSAQSPAFRARKATIDAQVASLAAACAAPELFPPAQAPHCVG